jgi:hypothetical protein
MKATRVFSDQDGVSHFEDFDIPLEDAGEIGRLSSREVVGNIIFRENDAAYDYGWHNAPERQYILLLDGEIEIEVGDGTIRPFRVGDILLVEDTTGGGHCTRVTNNRPRRSVFVTLP